MARSVSYPPSREGPSGKGWQHERGHRGADSADQEDDRPRARLILRGDYERDSPATNLGRGPPAANLFVAMKELGAT